MDRNLYKSRRRLLAKNSHLLVLGLLVVLVAGALWFFRPVVLPFALAIFLSYLLAPVIAWLTGPKVLKGRMPRGAAILLVYALVLGLIVLSGFYLFPKFYSEANRMVRTLPAELQKVEENMIVPLEAWVREWLAAFAPLPTLELGGGKNALANNGVKTKTNGSATAPTHTSTADKASSDFPAMGGAGIPAVLPPREIPWRGLVEDYTYVVRKVDETRYEVTPRRRKPASQEQAEGAISLNRPFTHIFGQMRSEFEENFVDLLKTGSQYIGKLLSSFFTLFLVLMISGFILLDPGRIYRFMHSMVPRRQHRSFDDWLRGLDRGLSGVVRGQVLICLVNGALTGVGIWIIGVPFVATLSVIAAIFSLIPIFGVLISSVPILLMGLTVDFTTAVLALAWILLVHFIEGNFLNPKILGDSARIHPALIVFALLVGEHFGGVLGALLAVPTFSLIQTSFLFLKSKAEHLGTAG